MRHRELAKRLEKLGCQFKRQGKGSHEIWVNPKTNKLSIVPNHASKDIPPGTIRGILKDLGLSRKEFGPIK